MDNMTGKNQFNLQVSKQELLTNAKGLQDNLAKTHSSRDSLIELYNLSKQLWEKYVMAHPDSYASKLFLERTSSSIMYSCPEIEKSPYNNMTHGDVDTQLSKYIILDSQFQKKKKDFEYSIAEIDREIKLCLGLKAKEIHTSFALSELLIGIEDYDSVMDTDSDNGEPVMTFVSIEDYMTDSELSVSDFSVRNNFLLRLEMYEYTSECVKTIIKKEFHHMYISEINKNGKSIPESTYWLEDTTLHGNILDFTPVNTTDRYLGKYASESSFLTIQIQSYINNMANDY